MLQDTLDAWLTCQAAWQYLEPIFSSPDIMAQMPEEGDKFATVDAAWKDVMDAASADPSALSAGRDRERLETLREANALLDEIQKGLLSGNHMPPLLHACSRHCRVCAFLFHNVDQNCSCVGIPPLLSQSRAHSTL